MSNKSIKYTLLHTTIYTTYIQKKKEVNMFTKDKIRNVSIIAHVEHGKTTIVDECGLRERERERPGQSMWIRNGRGWPRGRVLMAGSPWVKKKEEKGQEEEGGWRRRKKSEMAYISWTRHVKGKTRKHGNREQQATDKFHAYYTHSSFPLLTCMTD